MRIGDRLREFIALEYPVAARRAAFAVRYLPAFSQIVDPVLDHFLKSLTMALSASLKKRLMAPRLPCNALCRNGRARMPFFPMLRAPTNGPERDRAGGKGNTRC